MLVKFPEILSISNFIDKDCGFEGDATYILYAIVNHVGTISSRHYYSYVKIMNSKYYKDDKVKVVDLGYDLKKIPIYIVYFTYKKK